MMPENKYETPAESPNTHRVNAEEEITENIAEETPNSATVEQLVIANTEPKEQESEQRGVLCHKPAEHASENPEQIPESDRAYPYEQINHKNKREELYKRIAGTLIGCFLVGTLSLVIGLCLYTHTDLDSLLGKWGLTNTQPGYTEQQPETQTPAAVKEEEQHVDKHNTLIDPGDAKIEIVPEHGGRLTPQEVYQKVNPATVLIVGNEPGTGGVKNGTGVIFDADGLIVTNQHVISDCETYTVVLSDDRVYMGELVAENSSYDLAIVKIDADDLPTAEFGSSEVMVVGDSVYAIGNPIKTDLRSTFTAGIVSATNRYMTLAGNTQAEFIQTDAALNNGNSGGPLINEYGQVIGINSNKMGTITSAVEGIGLAIPSRIVEKVVNNLISNNETPVNVEFGVLVGTIGEFTPDGRVGLRVQEVVPGGDCEKAGVEFGDYLLEADGEPLSVSSQLLELRKNHQSGDTVVLKVYRNGETLDVPVRFS